MRKERMAAGEEVGCMLADPMDGSSSNPKSNGEARMNVAMNSVEHRNFLVQSPECFRSLSLKSFFEEE